LPQLRQIPDFPASWFLLRWQLPGRLRDLSKSTTSFAAISARQTPLISARLSAQISPLHLTFFLVACTTSFATISARQIPLISARLSARISPLHF
jgi:hypothetical protein